MKESKLNRESRIEKVEESKWKRASEREQVKESKWKRARGREQEEESKWKRKRDKSLKTEFIRVDLGPEALSTKAGKLFRFCAKFPLQNG